MELTKMHENRQKVTPLCSDCHWDKLTLYKLMNCQKQIAYQSQLIMLASVLRYTFREAQYTNTTEDALYIMTLKNITV